MGVDWEGEVSAAGAGTMTCEPFHAACAFSVCSSPILYMPLPFEGKRLCMLKITACWVRQQHTRDMQFIINGSLVTHRKVSRPYLGSPPHQRLFLQQIYTQRMTGFYPPNPGPLLWFTSSILPKAGWSLCDFRIIFGFAGSQVQGVQKFALHPGSATEPPLAPGHM